MAVVRAKHHANLPFVLGFSGRAARECASDLVIDSGHVRDVDPPMFPSRILFGDPEHECLIAARVDGRPVRRRVAGTCAARRRYVSLRRVIVHLADHGPQAFVVTSPPSGPMPTDTVRSVVAFIGGAR